MGNLSFREVEAVVQSQQSCEWQSSDSSQAMVVPTPYLTFMKVANVLTSFGFLGFGFVFVFDTNHSVSGSLLLDHHPSDVNTNNSVQSL